MEGNHQEQWLQLKIKFLLDYNMKIVIYLRGGINLCCKWLVFIGNASSSVLYDLFCTIFLEQLFLLLSGNPSGNVEPLSRGQPHSLDVIHCVFQVLTERSLGAVQSDCVPKPSRGPSGVWTGNLPVLSQRLNWLDHSPLKKVMYIFTNKETRIIKRHHFKIIREIQLAH